MYPEERQHAIATLVADRGRVSVAAVAEQFGVTTETVRRDLAVLERSGMLRRVHGGAVPTGALALAEPGLVERHGTRAEQKRKIAAAALDLLPGPDGSLVLDGGTTTAALAELLPADRRLLAVTQSVPEVVLDMRTFLAGRRSSGSMAARGWLGEHRRPPVTRVTRRC